MMFLFILSSKGRLYRFFKMVRNIEFSFRFRFYNVIVRR